MGNLDINRYNAGNVNELFNKIAKNSIGMDEYFDRSFSLHETTSNYPPFNLISVNNVTSRLEVALAGFKKKEVYVYTQDGKLFIEGQKEDKETETNYMHKERFLNGRLHESGRSLMTRKLDQLLLKMLLSIELGKVVPEAHKRKDWF